jgi:hypothetical protein
MEKYFLSQKTSLNSFSKNNRQNLIANTVENITDLLSLANDELERKSKQIYEMQARIDYLEGKDIQHLDEAGLNNLKNFYGSRLSSIVSEINNHKK